MDWFFERLNSSAEPVFGHKDKSNHKKEFAQLLALGLLKEIDIATEIECTLCDDGHHSTPFQNDDGFFVVCGSSKRKVEEDELRVWTINYDKFLQLIKDTLGITGKTIDETQGDKKLWKLGTNTTKHNTLHYYYLRQDSPLEFERLRNDVHDVRNAHNVIFTNTDTVGGPDNQNQFIPLHLLVDGGKAFFSVKKLEELLIKRRRVQFDTRTGNLYLDGNLLHAFGTSNEQKYFIEKLWNDFEQPVSNTDVYDFVRKKIGKGVADTAQKYCNKVKSAISKDYPDIVKVLIQPQKNEYMLKTPDR